MPIYDVGYSMHDDSKFVQLVFDKKLSKVELTDYVNAAYANVVRNDINKNDINKDQLDYYEAEGPDFCLVLDEVVQELTKLGFRRVEFDATFYSHEDGASLKLPEDVLAQIREIREKNREYVKYVEE